jgi:two-component system cell cycle response regulator
VGHAVTSYAGEETHTLLPSICISPRVLIVDDDEVVCSALKNEVEAAGYRASTACSGWAALESLQSSFAPLVILDRNMEGLQGLDVCRHIRSENYPGYVYIIFRTVLDEESDVIDGLEAGADDYLSKETSPRELIARLKTAHRILSHEHGLKHLLSEKRKMAMTDPLTGAHNRRYFMKYAEREVERAQSESSHLSLLALDIDNFKTINDLHGHAAGDGVLVECVRRIRSALRAEEDCVRWGGEEFVVILRNCDFRRAKRVAERLLATIALTPFRVADVDIPVTVSIGGSELDGCKNLRKISIESLLRQADECMYTSKRDGRNRVTLRRFDLQTWTGSGSHK